MLPRFVWYGFDSVLLVHFSSHVPSSYPQVYQDLCTAIPNTCARGIETLKISFCLKLS